MKQTFVFAATVRQSTPLAAHHSIKLVLLTAENMDEAVGKGFRLLNEDGYEAISLWACHEIEHTASDRLKGSLATLKEVLNNQPGALALVSEIIEELRADGCQGI